MKRIQVALIRGLIKALALLPLGWLYSLCSAFSWFACNVLQYRKSTVIVNLARSFPQFYYWDIDVVVKQFYRHLGDMIAEAIWFGGSGRKRIAKQNICSVSNPEVLNQLYQEHDGVLVLDSHCGNWEILGGFCIYNYSEEHPYPFTEKDLCVVYKKMSSEVMDEVIKRNRVNFVKESGRDNMVEASGLLRRIIHNKGRKVVYLCNADQFPYVGRFNIGRFLNQETLAMKGVLELAHKMKMPVAYMSMVHKGRGKYEISFVKLCDDASACEAEELVKSYYRELEKDIVATPHNWLWSHRRWKP